ncbi:hypothetical protein GCM10027406_01230 [Leifsonia lichenia]
MRFGAVATAVAVVAAGLLAATPANAAGPEITVANTTFTEGDWGTGLDVKGTGFAVDAPVVIAVANGLAVLAAERVTADADGSFASTFVPENALELPSDSDEVIVFAFDADNEAEHVVLTVLRTAGIEVDSATISAADLADREAGVSLIAGGFVPGETVTVAVTLDGENVQINNTLTADRSGSVMGSLWIIGASAGELVITLTGAAGHVETTTVTVTGEPASTPGENTPPTAEVDNAPAAVTPAVKLPVVSG